MSRPAPGRTAPSRPGKLPPNPFRTRASFRLVAGPFPDTPMTAIDRHAYPRLDARLTPSELAARHKLTAAGTPWRSQNHERSGGSHQSRDRNVCVER